MSLVISIRQHRNISIVDLRGRITIGADTDSFGTELRELTAITPCNILLNLTEVTQMDSTGINELVHSYARAARRGGSLKLLNPTGYVREVLEITHLTECLPIYTDEAEALASFGGTAAHA